MSVALGDDIEFTIGKKTDRSFRMNESASIGALFGGNHLQLVDLISGQAITEISIAGFDEFENIHDAHFIPKTDEIAICGGGWSSAESAGVC